MMNGFGTYSNPILQIEVEVSGVDSTNPDKKFSDAVFLELATHRMRQICSLAITALGKGTPLASVGAGYGRP